MLVNPPSLAPCNVTLFSLTTGFPPADHAGAGKHVSGIGHLAVVPLADVRLVEICSAVKHVLHARDLARDPRGDVHVEACRLVKHAVHARDLARDPRRDVRVEA